MSGGDTESLLAQCQRFALGYSELRAELTKVLATATRAPESLARVQNLAARVQSLDRNIVNWLASIPDEFRFWTVCWVSEDEIDPSGRYTYSEAEVFPGRVDVYPDFVTAMAWNIGRVARLILASLNVRLTAWLCSPADYRTTLEYEVARRICGDIISDIIASVPYHLGWKMNGRTLSNRRLSGFACGEEGTCKALPALFLLWSLTCVKNHDFCTEDQRDWAKGRLRFIASDVGLKYANIVNQVSSHFSLVVASCSTDILTGQYPLSIDDDPPRWEDGQRRPAAASTTGGR